MRKHIPPLALVLLWPALVHATYTQCMGYFLVFDPEVQKQVSTLLPEEKGILGDLAANPRDLALRGLFADLLTDKGQVKLAELIHTGCKMRKIENLPRRERNTAANQAEYQALARTQSEMLAKFNLENIPDVLLDRKLGKAPEDITVLRLLAEMVPGIRINGKERFPSARGRIEIIGGVAGGGVMAASRVNSVIGAPPSLGGNPTARFELDIDHPMILGRGGNPDYLTSGYESSPVGPSNVALSVSRAHLTVRSARDGRGLEIVNGVPSPEGEFRAPPNGTRMTSPQIRDLLPREILKVPPGESVLLQLASGPQLRITAESAVASP